MGRGRSFQSLGVVVFFVLEVVLVLLEVDGSPQWAAMPGFKVML